MLKKLTLTALLSFGLFSTYAQGWKKTYTTSGGDKVYLNDIKGLPDGGFIAAGETGGAAAGNAVLLRGNAQGTVLWAQSYDASGFERASKVSLHPDGGFVIAMNFLDTTNLNDNNVIFRSDTAGALVSGYEFTGNGVFVLQDLEVTPTGNIMVVGNSASCPTNFGCGFVAAFDGLCSPLWSKSIEGGFVTNFYDVINTSDNQLLVTGSVLDMMASEKGFIAKMDSTGQMSWANVFSGGFSSDRLYAATENAALQGFVLVGATLQSPISNYDALVITTNTSGNVQNSGFAGGTEGDEARQVFSLTGSDVFVGGYSEVAVGLTIHPQGLNLQLDVSNGNITNGTLLGVTSNNEQVAAMVPEAAGNVYQVTQMDVFSGNARTDFVWNKTTAPGSVCNETNYTSTTSLLNYTDAFGADTASLILTTHVSALFSNPLIVTAADGCVNAGISSTENTLSAHLYPNPAHDFLMIDCALAAAADLIVFNVNGERMLSQRILSGRSLLDVRQLPAGNYMAHVSDGTNTATLKFVVIR